MNDLNRKLYSPDLFGDPIVPAPTGPVAERFGFPPFSVFDARSGEWQDRKRAWLRTGIRSEVGRENSLLFSIPTSRWSQENRAEEYHGEAAQKLNTSIFDPTLCECVYRWFSAPGSQVLDPFAGGSVRGILAGMLGRRYWGCDLRIEQIEANVKQADEIAPEVRPTWVHGDAMEVLESAPEADLVFSCHPYGDLERYSDDPRDLSTQEWHTFRANYGRIILRAVSRLRRDRFACFVVGDFRDKRGFLRDFVSTTIGAFVAAGAELYNEAILVTSVGSASMRVTKQFDVGRKFAKTHQNILVFCKGDWRSAADHARGS